MKWLYWTAGIILTLFILIYVLLFTPPGNALLAPVIEQKMQDALNMPAKLKHFRLGTGHFEAVVALDEQNRLECAGNYGLFSHALSARYRAELGDLAALQPLIKQPLRGGFTTQGTVTGTLEALNIKGKSDLAGGETTYTSTVNDFHPNRIDVAMKHARIADLLFMTMQPPFAEGLLGIDANITLNTPIPAGEVRLTVDEGKMHTAIMQNEYNVTLPETTFTLESEGTYHADLARYTLALHSNLAHISSKGEIAPKALNADIVYDMKIKELGLFTPLTQMPLHGPLTLNGTLKGDRDKMNLVALSDLAGSHTRLTSTLIDLKPDTLKLDVKQLRLKKLLRMLNQPLYADAVVTLNADLTHLLKKKREGTVTLKMAQGVADRAVVAKAFDWPLFKGSRFHLDLNNRLHSDQVDSELDLDSDLLSLHAAPARFTISKRQFKTDYTATLPDLGKLYFLTRHPLRGRATITGDLAYTKDLVVHADSVILGGTVRSTFKEGKLHADLKNIKTLDALYMLTYPEVFDARLNGNLDYTPATKKGRLEATLSDGKFTKNSAFDLLRNYSNIDLYAERFKGEVTTRINDKILDTDLVLRSNRSSLSTRNARLDSEAKTIDAKVHLDANNNPVDFRLKGSLDHPKIAVDAGKLIEREAGKQIKRLLNDLFK